MITFIPFAQYMFFWCIAISVMFIFCYLLVKLAKIPDPWEDIFKETNEEILKDLKNDINNLK